MPLARPLAITKPVIIVGEGAGDAAFFQHLCALNQISNVQTVDARGTGKVEAFLKDLSSLTGFRDCKLIVLVGDNDNAPDDNFNDMRGRLKRAKLPFPNNPLEMTHYTNSDVQSTIMMLPFDDLGNRKRGCLETLLIESAFAKLPTIADCIPDFGKCIGVGDWSQVSHVDKFRLRAFLSAAFPDDPNFALQWALDPAHNVIPLNHSCFEPIVNFLRRVIGEL